MKFPKIVKIKQVFERPLLKEIENTISNELNRIGISKKIKPGQKIAITAGSRGINNIARITKAIVREFKAIGAQPFIVPAMGSHGGATAEGQLEILSHYGITEDFMGCPIKSSMEVQEVARSKEGIISYVDKLALSADYIVVVNRVKQHTEFEGAIESGLCKMLCIGLGKHQGALHYHRAGIDFGLEYAIRTGAEGVLKNTNVLCGIGIVENAYDETALIRAFLPEQIIEGDKQLLAIAKQWAAKLPFNQADVLIIDEIGKEISGSGYDTKVVGRLCSSYSKEPEWPKIKRIIALDLTRGSEGNAIGVGALDFVSKRLVDKINKKHMYINGITAQCPRKAAIPIYYETDRELLEQALNTIGLVEPHNAKIMRIKNTLHISELYVSENYLPEIKDSKNLEIISHLQEIKFDKNGNFKPFESNERN